MEIYVISAWECPEFGGGGSSDIVHVGTDSELAKKELVRISKKYEGDEEIAVWLEVWRDGKPVRSINGSGYSSADEINLDNEEDDCTKYHLFYQLQEGKL
ncbi:hypothetical protein SP15_209 [Bacillus phage SP-15]|uniref:Uncharacterized protein n=1 Tax=Bacillus phage SP-15 TaxID=1792032 RepID=A0A127AWD5_9CAUD|nr:hypothetical protein SP15_209 [Bacillus phage SP-15]AMM45009.1 hypothetical protein SP15_209 [Bacillus phage SP-15]